MCFKNALCSEPSPEVLPSLGKDLLAPAAAEPVSLLSQTLRGKSIETHLSFAGMQP